MGLFDNDDYFCYESALSDRDVCIIKLRKENERLKAENEKLEKELADLKIKLFN